MGRPLTGLHLLSFSARFFNVNLEGREDDIQDSEYWVGQIKEIRRSTTDPGVSGIVRLSRVSACPDALVDVDPRKVALGPGRS